MATGNWAGGCVGSALRCAPPDSLPDLLAPPQNRFFSDGGPELVLARPVTSIESVAEVGAVRS